MNCELPDVSHVASQVLLVVSGIIWLAIIVDGVVRRLSGRRAAGGRS